MYSFNIRGGMKLEVATKYFIWKPDIYIYIYIYIYYVIGLLFIWVLGCEMTDMEGCYIIQPPGAIRDGLEGHVVYGTGPGLGWPAGLCYLLGRFWISVSALCYSSLSLFFITVETKIYIYIYIYFFFF